MNTKTGDGEARRGGKGHQGRRSKMEVAPSPAPTRPSVVWVGDLRFVDLKSIDVSGWYYTPESIRKQLCGAHFKGFTSKAGLE
jgi:hypothetical protein